MQWVLLTGDMMLGRGVDLIQAASCDPGPSDGYGRTEREVLDLAERLNGAIPRPVDTGYVWGEALDALAPFETALRIVNLETAVTTSVDRADKRICYRMHPDNVAVIRAFGADCCVLANNHVFDWGETGLRETLGALDSAGFVRAGAGYDEEDAWRPAILPLPDGTRVIVLAMGDRSSGVLYEWAAGPNRPGLAVVEREFASTVTKAARIVREAKRPGDIAIASVHWGENWGFEIFVRQANMARDLINRAGIDIVHGHSSHHPRQIALYRGKPVLFGAGDLINDYEGLDRQREQRPDLVVLYLFGIEGGAVRDLRMLPMRIRRMRLERASPDEARWLCARASRHSAPFGTGWHLAHDGTIRLTRRKPQLAEASA
jgi:poly-gamma-glutamate capsule biosynthesis protein CapA/YwtB (metallophosphatase superfamily)